MTLRRRRFLQISRAAAALPALPAPGDWRAETYPSRTVRIIVATSAGGTTDIVARLLAQWLADKLGQPFVVENRTGGSNNIGTEAAARSPPDGYTLFMANFRQCHQHLAVPEPQLQLHHRPRSGGDRDALAVS